MSKFEEDFGDPFDGFSHKNPNIPYERRKRSNENPPLDALVISDMSLSASQSTSQPLAGTTGSKKAKIISEINSEKGVTSLTEDTLAQAPKNNTTFQSKGSEGNCQEGMLMSAASKRGSRIEAALQDEGKESQMLLLKWKPPFTESEAFEAFFPSRMDQLLKDVLQLEAHLKNQKEQLRSRLTHLSQTLKIQMK